MAQVDLGKFWIRSYIPGSKKQPTYELKCWLGDEPPRVISGYAKWEIIERRYNKPITEWAGLDPLRVEVSLLIDYFVERDGEACERDIRQLEILAGASQKDQPPQEPHVVLWDGNAMHDDREAGHLRWVIESLEWGRMWWNKNLNPLPQGTGGFPAPQSISPGGTFGNIIRAEAKIVLMEYVDEVYMTSETGRIENGKYDTYRVQKGDTIKKIAKKLKVSAKELLKINSIRDQNAVLKRKTIRIPRKQAKKGSAKKTTKKKK